jgi:hypothetical protein
VVSRRSQFPILPLLLGSKYISCHRLRKKQFISSCSSQRRSSFWPTGRDARRGGDPASSCSSAQKEKSPILLAACPGPVLLTNAARPIQLADAGNSQLPLVMTCAPHGGVESSEHRHGLPYPHAITWVIGSTPAYFLEQQTARAWRRRACTCVPDP